MNPIKFIGFILFVGFEGFAKFVGCRECFRVYDLNSEGLGATTSFKLYSRDYKFKVYDSASLLAPLGFGALGLEFSCCIDRYVKGLSNDVMQYRYFWRGRLAFKSSVKLTVRRGF